MVLLGAGRDSRGHVHQVYQAHKRIPVSFHMLTNWKPEPQAAARKIYNFLPGRNWEMGIILSSPSMLGLGV